jgi:acetyl-CoA/propionyl-CoA carboxylase biotin carboxyl carrier protein
MFGKILMANRGEIAVRVARTCRELGVSTVAVYSDVDAQARHVAAADEGVHVPGVAPVETYLNVEAIIEAARSTGAEAIHPGYGFLSERGDAAAAVTDAGLVWIGPPPDAIRAAGDKVEARRLARSADVPVVPGTLEPVADLEEVRAFGREHGYPVAIKATGGGGGRGLKVAQSEEEIESAFDSARREAEAYFGSGDVYLERYLPRPKHIEVQVLAPRIGQAMWLGARDCSMQRRHQKLIEETPPPLFGAMVGEMGRAAVRVSNACGYVNAGTVEFLVDPAAPDAPSDRAPFYFLEINARLQVEHTITEEVLGIDLVAAQLRISSGEPLGLEIDEARSTVAIEPRGHAIECRINAENPRKRFLPGPGRITRYREPGGPGIRVDSGFGEGDEVPRDYDSLVAKLVAWGETREESRQRMLRALGEFEIEGIPSTIPAHQVLLTNPEFVDGTYSTVTVESGALRELEQAPSIAKQAAPRKVLMVNGTAVMLWNPAIAVSISAGATARDAGHVVAPMHGTILNVLVSEGDEIDAGDVVALLEAMKMETQVTATTNGAVKEILVAPGEVVEAGQAVAVVE